MISVQNHLQPLNGNSIHYKMFLMRNTLIFNIKAGLFLVLLILACTIGYAQEGSRKHVVSELDNYYSLSLKYDLTIEELKLANPGISSPKPGDILVIPEKGTLLKESHDNKDCPKNSKNRNVEYHVALMVPLSLEQLTDTLWNAKLEPNRINELTPFRFIQFYQGFMMAADSLEKQGLKVKIFVYDVDNQINKVDEVLRKPEMKTMDLIVGPLFKNSFSKVAGFADENKIPIVNPLSPRPDILQGNPYVFKLLPSVESQPAIVADLVWSEYRNFNILFYIDNKFQNSELMSQFTAKIEAKDPEGKLHVKVVDYASDSTLGFRKHASLSKPNLVIIYAENEVLPAALLSKLAAAKDEYQVTVIGLPEWEKLGNIETKYLISLNTNILMASYTDTGSESVKSFITAYRSRYLDEPMTYALTGFDAGYYFLNALMNYGKDFYSCADDISFPLIQNNFRFMRSVDGGYDNTNWNVLQYLDYYLLKKSFY